MTVYIRNPKGSQENYRINASLARFLDTWSTCKDLFYFHIAAKPDNRRYLEIYHLKKSEEV